MNYRFHSVLAPALLLLAALVPASAHAHFVWLGVTGDTPAERTAHIWFSEIAAPGEAQLVEKIAATQLHAIAGNGTKTKLQTKTVVEGETGGLDCYLEQPCAALVAQIDYGVIDRGDGPFLLKYFARHLVDPTKPFTSDVRHQLPVDLEANLKDDKLHLTVLVDGKPRSGVEVLIDAPRGKPVKLETDESGQVMADAVDQGVYGIRAKVVAEQCGEFKGEKYAEVRQYATLTFQLNRPVDGGDLLTQARENRATWVKFPGFTADIVVSNGQMSQRGRLQVSPSGKVELTELPEKIPGLERTLTSMVNHRFSNDNDAEGVSLVEEKSVHPLGQLIKLDYDTAMGSSYRIDKDVIRQVNRETGGGRFTISVLDVSWNRDGEYLPAVYSVNFWNKDGSLRSTTTVQDDWVRIEHLDLPKRHFAVSAGQDELKYLRVEFSNHKLLK